MRYRILASLTAVLSTAAFTPIAFGQANQIQGIDVSLGLLGDFNDVGHTGTYPTGRTGMSMSTTSCNFGTLQAAWQQAMDPDHPFICFQLLRESDGRMVQISDHSYVKHGFFALSNNQCGLGCSGTNGTALGVGCSDTYGIGNNSDTFWLGPPDEIDPWSGEWNPICSLFDGPNCDGSRSYFGAVPDSVAHRMEIEDADLAVPNARFYYASIYIVEHEPEEVRWNNLGYRECNITWTGTQYNVQELGSTTPTYGTPLQEWEGSILHSTKNGGDDGRVYVASKTEDTMGGTHYEYAIHNRDNAGGFSMLRIPIAPGTQVSNFGFHDIDQDAANDWNMQVVGNFIEISTDNNPLKWNSVFNFWFDADTGPVVNSVELDQFVVMNNGMPTLSITAAVPGEGSIQPCMQIDDFLEDNDSCATAAPVPGGTQSSLYVTKTDEDWYQITVPSSEILDLDVEFAHAFGDIDIELVDACGGNVLASGNSTTDDESLSFTNTTGTDIDVFARVFVFQGDANDCNNYNMVVGVAPPGPCSVPDDNLEPNDDCASAVAAPNGLTPNLFVSKVDPDFYTIPVGIGGTLTVNVAFMGSVADIDVELTQGCGGTVVDSSTSAGSFEQVMVTNNTNAQQDYKLRIYVWPGSSGDCNSYNLTTTVQGGQPPTVTPFCYGDGSGTACPCNNDSTAGHQGGCRHSVGDGAKLEATGVTSISNDTMQMRISSGPANTYGLLISGDNQMPSSGSVGSGVAMFDGLMCVGGNQLRHGARFINVAGNNAVVWGFPNPGIIESSPFVAGQTRHFQVIFRDMDSSMCMTGQNSSNGVSVEMLP